MPAFTQANGLDVNNLSHDQKVIEAYTSDPLVHDLVSGVVGLGIIEWGEWLLESPKSSNVPILIMHGDQDVLTNHDASREFAQTNHLDFKSWPCLFHEIHNEFEKEQVFEYALKWIHSKT